MRAMVVADLARAIWHQIWFGDDMLDLAVQDYVEATAHLHSDSDCEEEASLATISSESGKEGAKKTRGPRLPFCLRIWLEISRYLWASAVRTVIEKLTCRRRTLQNSVKRALKTRSVVRRPRRGQIGKVIIGSQHSALESGSRREFAQQQTLV
eukprot:TRINITY_DN71412_c0_g1_i1.p1 TRINITY_DN71412_c0_g1~~TRINITY_DN71412_c0_g1_i1.p1  ORF type:complete len:153 (-),score=10.60 TRINITY_DN71412_c0_g1_i1:76-534(-)